MAGNNTTNIRGLFTRCSGRCSELFSGCCQSDRAVECQNRAKRYLHLLKLQATALTTRLMFGILGLVTIWRVTDVYDANVFYVLAIPVLLLAVEFVITNKYTESGEWKW